MDHLSGWVEIVYLPGMTVSSVIKVVLKQVSLVENIHSDNGGHL